MMALQVWGGELQDEAYALRPYVLKKSLDDKELHRGRPRYWNVSHFWEPTWWVTQSAPRQRRGSSSIKTSSSMGGLGRLGGRGPSHVGGGFAPKLYRHKALVCHATKCSGQLQGGLVTRLCAPGPAARGARRGGRASWWCRTPRPRRCPASCTCTSGGCPSCSPYGVRCPPTRLHDSCACHAGCAAACGLGILRI